MGDKSRFEMFRYDTIKVDIHYALNQPGFAFFVYIFSSHALISGSTIVWLPFSYFIFDQLHAVAVHYCVSEWYETLIDIVVARTFKSSQCRRRIWGGPQAHCISQCTPDTALAPPRHKVASQDERLHHVFIRVSSFSPSFSLAWLSSAWL